MSDVLALCVYYCGDKTGKRKLHITETKVCICKQRGNALIGTFSIQTKQSFLKHHI